MVENIIEACNMSRVLMQNFFEFFHMTEVSFNGKFTDYFGDSNILDKHTLIVFDTETTGLDPRIPHVQVLSVSAASFDVNQEKLLDVFNHFADLNPETKEKARLDAIHKIKQDGPSYKYIDDFLIKSKWNDAQKSGSEIDVINKFVGFLDQFDNAMLCGYNIGFDLRMINTVLKKHEQKPISLPVMDVMRFVHVFLDPTIEALAAQGIPLAKDMLGSLMNSANKKSYNLSNVAKILNVLRADGHVSLADIEMTGKVLTQAIKFIKDHSDKLGPDFHNFERKSRREYKDKLGYFHSIRNQSLDSYKKTKKFMQMVEKDVVNGSLAVIKHLENQADKERQGLKRYKLLRDIQLKVNGLKNLLDEYQGDPSKILAYIYNL